MAERENVKDLEFKWGQKMGVDFLEKEVQFYESFTYDGTEYTLYDCVYMYKEGEPEPYIGKLIGIWETVDRAKKVNVQWFFRPSEISKWLVDQTPLQKEIFLATGEGIGLSNVNPLEAIAGKCYVICTSEDRRNRKPSVEETKLADFIFYRTFNVGQCTLSDKMDDCVGGLAVNYVFNREESNNMNAVQTHGFSKVEGVCNTLACKGKNKLLISNSSDESELLGTEGHRVNNVVMKDVKGASVESGGIPGESSDYRSGNNSNVCALTNEQKQVSASGQRAKTGEVQSATDGVKKVTNNKSRAKEKLSSDAMQDKPTKKARISNFTKPCEDKISNSAKNLLIQGDNSMMCAFAPKDETKFDDKNLSLNRGVGVAKKGGLKDRPIGILKKGSSNQAKKVVTFNETNTKDFIKRANHVERTSRFVEGSGSELKSTSKGGSELTELKSTSKGCGSELTELKSTSKGCDSELKGCDSELKSTSKERVHENTRKFSNNTMSKKSTSKGGSELTELKSTSKGCGSELKNTSKERVHENTRKFSNSTMSKMCATEMESREMEQKIATRNMDKGKWWTTTNKMLNAARGTTLLLWNLDPKYTSEDVKDFIDGALQTSCVAKMLPRTKISSPHSGQALIKFNNIETTERVLQKLSEGCLMLPNGRPLVATESPPLNSTEGQCTYFGHLVIDSIKLQGDARDAVSTSHCSQPNTIEYEMAMEWCLLQTQFDRCWEDLYKLHKEEMRRLKAKLKSK